jgi:hypothetical protein
MITMHSMVQSAHPDHRRPGDSVLGTLVAALRPTTKTLGVTSGSTPCDTLRDYSRSRYRFGKALAAYKVFFIEGRGWVEAAKIIGRAIDRDAKTIYRIVADYERASQVPVEAIEELEALGIDPAAKKNVPVLTNILQMAAGAVKSKPKEAVTQAVKAAKAEKAAKKPSQSVPFPAISEPESLSREEKLRRDIRQKVRAGLTNVPNDRKLAELQAAVEEEMYEVWGVQSPQTVTFTPRPSALTLDGHRKLEVAA